MSSRWKVQCLEPPNTDSLVKQTRTMGVNVDTIGFGVRFDISFRKRELYRIKE